MGMFDIVLVPCAQCGELYQAQSKSGPQMMKTYHFPYWRSVADEELKSVMKDVNRHAPFQCDKCNTQFEVVTIETDAGTTYTVKDVTKMP